MADDTPTSEAPQAGTPETNSEPQAGSPTTSTTPQAGESHNSESISLDEAKKLRSEAANLRKRLKSFEDAEQAAKDAQLSEVERITKQYAEIQAQLEQERLARQELVLRTSINEAASAQRFVYPDLAYKLVALADLETDDDGSPKNADKLVKKLRERYPKLFAEEEQQQQQAAPETQQQAPTTPQAPAIPAMNPGRANIPAPGTGTPGRPMRLSEIQWKGRN